MAAGLRRGLDALRGALSLITVEPVEFIYCLMFSVSNIVRDNLFIDKVCLLEKRFPEEVCHNMTHGRPVDEDLKVEVQKRVSELEVIDGVLVALPSVVFCLFLGAWSDSNGRKLILILPFLGNLVSFVAYMVNYAFFYELGVYHLLWGSTVGLSGGYICLNIALYGYIGDVTDHLNRTTRMSVLNGVFSAGYVAGNTLGGKLFKAFGSYYLNFGLSCGLAVLGCLYVVFMVRESVAVSEDPERRRRFFDWKNAKDSLATAVKPRPGSGRLRVLFLILNFAVFMFPLNSTHYDYLLVNKRYNWDAFKFSQYLSAQRICRFLGLFLLLPVLSRVLRLGDSLISAAGTALTIVAYLLVAAGSPDWKGPDGTWDAGWIMFLSAALQFNSIITVTIRSQSTKEVDADEIGRIFSVVGFGQALVPLASNPLFGFIYRETVDTFPGAYVLTIAALLFVVLSTSLYMMCSGGGGGPDHRGRPEDAGQGLGSLVDLEDEDQRAGSFVLRNQVRSSATAERTKRYGSI